MFQALVVSSTSKVQTQFSQASSEYSLLWLYRYMPSNIKSNEQTYRETRSNLRVDSDAPKAARQARCSANMKGNNMEWKDYDPEWLARLAEQQEPDQPWLPDAIRKCTKYHSESDAYYHFVSADNPNQEGSEWQFDYNIILEDEKEGDIVLDVLKDKRIGGIEFISRIRA